jgi:surface carbohydrate biosynthesis protein
MSRDIDVLWLVEHTAREMDVACVARALGRARYGLATEIRNIYQHIGDYLTAYRPRVVVHPFVYVVKGALATEDVFARWPGAVHFNLAWEQIHYRAHVQIKAPADEAARLRTIHHGWGEFYRAYLTQHGVPEEHIFINGHPSYRLYAEPYRRFFASRDHLAKAFGLDPAKRWIFVPDNYRWAFAQRKLKFFLSQGGDARELQSLVDFSVPSLEHLLRACRLAAADEGLELILRPRPSVSTHEFLRFFRERVGEDTGRIRLLKEGSVREWIMASDAVISSYSTSLIEAAVAGKPAWMFEPIPIPPGLYCEWYDHVGRIRDTDAFLGVCREPAGAAASDALREWAHANLLACGDPLQRLTLKLALLADGQPRSLPEGRLPRHLATRKYFNQETHEKDAFSPTDVDILTGDWASLLGSTPPRQEVIADWSRGDVVNKSMDRDDLLAPESAPLVEELNTLVRRLYARGAPPSSWIGTLPHAPLARLETTIGARLRRRVGPRGSAYATDAGEQRALTRARRQRVAYRPLPGAADDCRLPWFLYWEIAWIMCQVRPRLEPGMRLLAAGGAGSLFACYLGSRGLELHCVDVDERLIGHGQHVARTMGWTGLFSHAMRGATLPFSDAYFDHAFSVGGLVHSGFEIAPETLGEIARCLKPDGLLALTFDYRGNALRSEADIHRTFLKGVAFRMVGNPLFHDNWKSYLRHPPGTGKPYTVGAILLQRR